MIPLASVVNGLQELIRATCRVTTDVLNHDRHGDFWHFVPGAVWRRAVSLGAKDPEGVRQLESAGVEGR